MGTEELDETLLNPKTEFKVHHSMCTTLKRLTDKVADIFPDIEAARPGYSSGIQALCLLNNCIEKSKQLLEYCRESSKLYLAITGESTIIRFQNVKNTMENSLDQIRSNVPVMLSAEISSIIDDLRATPFSLNSSDEEAGKVLLGLLRNSPSASEFSKFNEKEAVQFAVSRLLITSEKAIIIEKRAIKKLLSRIGENEACKKKILRFFLFLLKKYRSVINEDLKMEASHLDENVSEADCYENQIAAEREPERKLSIKLTCPISGNLMYDPVVISSGETFERMWIQKWFREGHTRCPKTDKNLTDFTLTPNNAVRSLISDFCLKHGVRVADPRKSPVYSLDVSSSSIVSLCSAMNDMQFPLDASNVSFESSDYNPDSCSKIMDVGLASVQETEDHEDVNLDVLSSHSESSWEQKCKVVDSLKYQLQCNPQSKLMVRPDKLFGPIITFLIYARDNGELTALKKGSDLLLMIVKKHRSLILSLDDEAFGLLVSLLDTQLCSESLAIFEVLSTDDQSLCLKMGTTCVLLPLVKLIESSNRQFQEMAIRILINLSAEKDVCYQIIALGCTPKLLPLLNDAKLAKSCITLMRNICVVEQGRASVAETEGCIGAIAELLEGGTHEEQEQAVELILFLCTMRVEYCHLVMNEMIVPSLVYLSYNGNDKGKTSALELLRQLRDVDFEHKSEVLRSDQDTIRQADTVVNEDRKPPSKKRGFKFFNKFISKKETCT